MFDIVFNLMLEFIGMLSWFIPFLIVFGIVGRLIREGGRRWYMYQI